MPLPPENYFGSAAKYFCFRDGGQCDDDYDKRKNDLERTGRETQGHFLQYRFHHPFACKTRCCNTTITITDSGHHSIRGFPGERKDYERAPRRRGSSRANGTLVFLIGMI
jgi:hypothetical protein